MTTPNLKLPEWSPSQEQPHVTVNEALHLLDATVQLAVISDALTTPPVSPADGASYIVAAPAVGAWAGWEGNIATYIGGAWVQVTPQNGWIAWVTNQANHYLYNSGWSTLNTGGGGGGGRLPTPVIPASGWTLEESSSSITSGLSGGRMVLHKRGATGSAWLHQPVTIGADFTKYIKLHSHLGLQAVPFSGVFFGDSTASDKRSTFGFFGNDKMYYQHWNALVYSSEAEVDFRYGFTGKTNDYYFKIQRVGVIVTICLLIDGFYELLVHTYDLSVGFVTDIDHVGFLLNTTSVAPNENTFAICDYFSDAVPA